eukprot:364362-Chlamydomonas_euryale.AAC.15
MGPLTWTSLYPKAEGTWDKTLECLKQAIKDILGMTCCRTRASLSHLPFRGYRSLNRSRNAVSKDYTGRSSLSTVRSRAHVHGLESLNPSSTQVICPDLLHFVRTMRHASM